MEGKLSRFERNVVKYYIETGNVSESARRAGSKGKDSSSLYTVGKRVLDRVGLTIQEIQEINGITDQHLTNKLQEGLEAKKKYFGSWQGQIIESEEFDDVPTRLKALEIAHKLRGQFIDRQELTGRDGGDIILQVKPAVGRKETKKIELDMD